MVRSHLVTSSVFAMLLFSAVTTHAKTISIQVNVGAPIYKHLAIITQAESSDLLEINVSNDMAYSKSTVCQYVSALRTSRATIHFGNIPNEVKEYAQQCNEGL